MPCLDGEDDMETEKLWIEESERHYREYKEGKAKTKRLDMAFLYFRYILH